MPARPGPFALAFEHHLAIGRNVPLDMLLGWLTSLAPRGVVEFVPKSDPTIQRMLAARCARSWQTRCTSSRSAASRSPSRSTTSAATTPSFFVGHRADRRTIASLVLVLSATVPAALIALELVAAVAGAALATFAYRKRAADGVWTADGALVTTGLRQYLQQVEFVDRLLDELVSRMKHVFGVSESGFAGELQINAAALDALRRPRPATPP